MQTIERLLAALIIAAVIGCGVYFVGTTLGRAITVHFAPLTNFLTLA